MSAVAAVQRTLRRVRRRVTFDLLAMWMPMAIAGCVLAWRVGGAVAAALVAAFALAATGIAIANRLRRLDRDWLLSRLDAARPDLDDSSGLLFHSEDRLGALQRLQRSRLLRRLDDRPPPDLRPAWSARPIAIAWLASSAVALAALLWPARPAGPAQPALPAEAAVARRGEPRLVAQSLQLRPPAYTGLDASRSDALDAKAPAGSTLRWTLRYAPQPTAVELVFHDGRRLALERDGEDWVASTVLHASTLYRVVPAGVAGAEDAALHRLDAIPDQPPRVRVLAPERGLTLLEDGPRDWPLRFEVSDDHGVAPRARLRITRTEGSGENIRFHEHERVLQGTGDRRTQRFTATLSPSTYGLQRGEDLVARLEVLDNRAPQPQQARSASLILRWPPEPVPDAEGLDGLARQVLPAYFRSQRQIIIDAQALLKDKPRLATDEFERRSDTIGVDQRLLRLRYGQFLGEESEGGRTLPTADLPTSDLPTNDAPATDAPAVDAHDDDHAHGRPPTAAHDHGDDARETPAAGGFGELGNVLEAFGHTHDIAEAATLLDPQTRDTLREALREMWQSELHLRQAAPAQALPYAHRALALIKQVQQADRIYLQRVGRQLPPIDETRRLGGSRDGLGNRPLPALAPVRGDAALAGAWRSLEDADAATLAVQLDALQAWVDANRDRVSDPLAWIAHIDALRRDPDCAACRDALRALLWSGLPRQAGGISRRDGDDPLARRYLDALREGEAR